MTEIYVPIHYVYVNVRELLHYWLFEQLCIISSLKLKWVDPLVMHAFPNSIYIYANSFLWGSLSSVCRERPDVLEINEQENT